MNMGRKGVSKRKPNQTKSKPFSSDKASGGVSSVMQALDSQPVKPSDPGKASQARPSSDRKKTSRKG
jgi:hypothetical protein